MYKNKEIFMYQVSSLRYKSMEYRRCGKSGLKLPALSLGLWHNFGDTAVYENMRKLCTTAFDNGITHFDLANNYGPRPGAAEENFKKILKDDLGQYRDELIISTKAGYTMWDGPYGDWGSRKYLLASLDQSLKRMGLEYVDIFYHHRMDPETPLEETMGALATAVSSGKALYVGLSNYNGEKLKQACAILEELHVPFVINQNRYSIFERDIENNGLKEAVKETQKGLIKDAELKISAKQEEIKAIISNIDEQKAQLHKILEDMSGVSETTEKYLEKRNSLRKTLKNYQDKETQLIQSK